ncbi:MAG: type II secretion system protein [Candidatus Omnitrophota bacterium]
MKLRRPKGFTLVEIMIVVAIIALLSAISIPNLFRSRLNANEAVAQGTLGVVTAACENFRAAQTPMRVPLNFAELTAAVPPYLDTSLDTAVVGIARKGYNYSFTRFNDNQFVCCASPEVYQATGERTFCVNETGVLRSGDNGGAIINTEAAYYALTVCN